MQGGVGMTSTSTAPRLGPWERLPEPLLGSNPSGAPNCDVHDVSNPVVAFMADGRVLMAFKGEGKTAGCTSGVIGLATAPHWRGPWTRARPTSEGSSPQRLGATACEVRRPIEPFIFSSQRA